MEEINYKWIFPGNNYTNENGLDTADMETFKKDPMASLAREICQNSIDARANDNDKTKVVFKPFTINRKNIPDIENLQKEIESCLDYWKTKNSKTTIEQLEKMLAYIKKEEINCLRISDYNTTGLSGVYDTDNGSFYLLTKGSGISNKEGTKGGSKGIGKFATFVTSHINTVFYSTLNQNNEEGYLGISKLCSTRMSGTDEKTIGTGYYGCDSKNSAIKGQLHLQEGYTRETTGTDIYIIGFKSHDDWKKEIVTKILESFMVAIMYDELEVQVDEIILNKTTLSELMEEYKEQKDIVSKSIVSQHILLTDNNVITGEIPVVDYGHVIVKVKAFNVEERDLTTNECVMIRSPYMKIKSLKHITSIPFSALCIIENNIINEMLRKIENPEHTDWQIKRIEDKDEQDELRNIKNSLEQNVKKFIQEQVQSSENNVSDIEGASDYLPSEPDEDGNGTEEAEVISETSKIVKRVKNKNNSKVGNFIDKDSDSLQPDIGKLIEGQDDEDAVHPEGHNNGNNGEIHSSDNRTSVTDGDDEILTFKQLTGIKYRIICPNKKEGKLVVAFDSNYEESNCTLEISYIDNTGYPYSPNIYSAKINGEDIVVTDGKLKNFKLSYGKTKIELYTDIKELYAWEVKIYANKE